MYVERPHLRFDGLYCSRNTYIRTGVTEWRVKNPVHLVCYYRYFRCSSLMSSGTERHVPGQGVLTLSSSSRTI